MSPDFLGGFMVGALMFWLGGVLRRIVAICWREAVDSAVHRELWRREEREKDAARRRADDRRMLEAREAAAAELRDCLVDIGSSNVYAPPAHSDYSQSA